MRVWASHLSIVAKRNITPEYSERRNLIRWFVRETSRAIELEDKQECYSSSLGHKKSVKCTAGWTVFFPLSPWKVHQGVHERVHCVSCKCWCIFVNIHSKEMIPCVHEHRDVTGLPGTLTPVLLSVCVYVCSKTIDLCPHNESVFLFIGRCRQLN